MFKTIKSKILVLVIGLMAITSITFVFITTKSYQIKITDQYHKLAKETLDSTLRIIDTEYNDLLSFEINAISNHRLIMEEIGKSILSTAELFYDLQKTGVLTEQLAKEQYLKKLNEYRYDTNKYFFVYDFNMVGLSHPNKEMVGKTWYGFEDIKKRDALTLIREVIKSEKQMFTVFKWPRLKDMKPVKQIGFFSYFPQWEWIIGTAHEMSDIEKIALAKEKQTLSKLKNILGQSSLNEIGEILISDIHGKVIIHTSNKKGIDLHSAGSILNKSLQDLLKRAVSDPGKFFEHQQTNRNQTTTLHLAYVDYYKYMGWYISIFIDKDESLRAVTAIALRQIIFFMLVLLFGIVFAFFISRKITFPLSLLTQYARDLPGSNFTKKNNPLPGYILSKSNDEEIKQLINSFAYMETRLGKNIQELEKYKNHLETLVKLRTKELTDANENLILEITEHKQTEKMLNILNESLDKKVKERTIELKRLNEHIVNSEENERNVIASDLHDSATQTIGLCISKINNFKESGSEYGLDTMSQIQEYLEQADKEIRTIIYQLKPPVLDDFAIDIVIGFLIEETNDKHPAHIKYTNNLDEPVRLHRTNKITLYRAVSELIANILKHSGTLEAQVELTKIKNNIQVRVEDKGAGFDIKTKNKSNNSGFGLFGLSERLTNVGGEIKINSTIGKGTKVVIFVPINM